MSRQQRQQQARYPAVNNGDTGAGVADPNQPLLDSGAATGTTDTPPSYGTAVPNFFSGPWLTEQIGLLDTARDQSTFPTASSSDSAPVTFNEAQYLGSVKTAMNNLRTGPNVVTNLSDLLTMIQERIDAGKIFKEAKPLVKAFKQLKKAIETYTREAHPVTYREVFTEVRNARRRIDRNIQGEQLQRSAQWAGCCACYATQVVTTPVGHAVNIALLCIPFLCVYGFCEEYNYPRTPWVRRFRDEGHSTSRQNSESCLDFWLETPTFFCCSPLRTARHCGDRARETSGRINNLRQQREQVGVARATAPAASSSSSYS